MVSIYSHVPCQWTSGFSQYKCFHVSPQVIKLNAEISVLLEQDILFICLVLHYSAFLFIITCYCFDVL